MGTAYTGPREKERQENRYKQANKDVGAMDNIASCFEEGLKVHEEPGSCGFSTMYRTTGALKEVKDWKCPQGFRKAHETR